MVRLAVSAQHPLAPRAGEDNDKIRVARPPVQFVLGLFIAVLGWCFRGHATHGKAIVETVTSLNEGSSG